MTTCSATIAKEPGDWGFDLVPCGQKVGVTTFVTTGGLRVGYCSRDGHEGSVRRRFTEQPDLPEPRWLHEMPEYADPMTLAKAEADSVTASSESEMRALWGDR